MRHGCIDCRLIEPEPGTWIDGICPRCAAYRATPIRPPAARFGPKMVDLAGRVFGRLTVQGFSHRDARTNRPMWRCLCSCSEVCMVLARNLISGNTLSCGCYRRDRMASVAKSQPLESRRESQRRMVAKIRSNALRIGRYVPNPRGPSPSAQSLGTKAAAAARTARAQERRATESSSSHSSQHSPIAL
jgi:hypothetical protein